MPKQYLSDEVVKIIHKHFANEHYPVKNHEEGFEKAVKSLKNNDVDTAKLIITQRVQIGELSPDSRDKPQWHIAHKKANTIVKELAKVIPVKKEVLGKAV